MASHPTVVHRPRLAAFPKAYLDDLCVTGKMTLRDWLQLVASLGVDGTELYAGAIELADRTQWRSIRRIAADLHLAIPMLCCSPDFTHNCAEFRRSQIEQEKRWIDMCAELGGQYCRILSGQRRPDVTLTDGVRYCVEAFEECVLHARSRGIVLVIENHYKDPYWEYPEFAQRSEVLCEILAQVPDDHLKVNFDPSNALVAGENPLVVLDKLIGRTATMHASDRYLKTDSGLPSHSEVERDTYSELLHHGEIGRGLNDYDAIFSALAGAGFVGWISIEDGVNSFGELQRSAQFLKGKMSEYWPAY